MSHYANLACRLLELAALGIVAFNLVMVGYSWRGDWQWSTEDDVRQNLFIYAQSQDPELFPDDLTVVHAEAFQPLGYQLLVSALSGWIDIVIGAKLVGIFVALVCTVLLVAVAASVFGFRSLFFWLSLIFATGNAYVWFMAMPGMPRSFSMPLSLLALLAFVRSGPWLFAVTSALAALFSPTVLVYLGLLAPFKLLRDGTVALRHQLRILWKNALVVGISLAAGVGVVYLDRQPVEAALGPVADYAEWQSDPAFQPGGRWAGESLRPLLEDLWLVRERSIPLSYDKYRLGVFGLLLIAAAYAVLRPSAGSGPPYDRPALMLRAYAAFVAAGLIGWALASQLALELYFPDRQLIPVAPATLFATFALGHIVYVWLRDHRLMQRRPLRFLPPLGIVAFLLVAFPTAGYRDAEARRAMNIHLGAPERELLSYLREHVPKDAVVAGSPVVMDDVPLFAKRSVYVSWEMTLPLYPSYYEEMVRRTYLLIPAYFAGDASAAALFGREAGVGFMVVKRDDFDEGGRPWTSGFIHTPAYIEPFTSTIQSRVAAQDAAAGWWWQGLGDGPAAVFTNDDYLVVDLKAL